VIAAFCQCATMGFEISHSVVMIYDANWPFCAVWKRAGWAFKKDWKRRRGGWVGFRNILDTLVGVRFGRIMVYKK